MEKQLVDYLLEDLKRSAAEVQKAMEEMLLEMEKDLTFEETEVQ